MILALLPFALADDPPADPPADPPPDDAPQEDNGAPEHEVVVEARRDSPTVSEQVLDRERVLQTPGTFEDPVRLVQALPGVSVTPEYGPAAGDLAIRGADPRESRYYLDGVELPYLYHFNGYSSVFHSRILDELTLEPSTFGAKWGDATGGIVDTRSAWSRPEKAHGSVNLNLVMGGAAAEVPIGQVWLLRASARRSYLDLASASDEQYTVFPVFWDYFGRAEHDLGEGARYGLFAFGSGDSYSRYAGEPTLLDAYEQSVNPSFAYDTSFHAAGFVHRHIGSSYRAEGSASWTGYWEGGSLPDASAREVSHRIQLREDVVSRSEVGHSLAMGVDAIASHTAIDVATTREWPEVARESDLLARGVAGNASTWRLRAGAYAEGRLKFGDLRVVPGLRIDGDTLTGEFVADPRFNARLQISKDTRVRAAAGVYHQFPEPDLVLAPFGDPALGPSQSTQVAGAFETAIAGRLELTVEGYYTHGTNLVVTDPGEAPRGGVEGQAYGVELGTRYRMRDFFFGSITVAAGHSERDGRLSDYDQPWTVNAVASWTFLPTWNVGLRYRAAAGLPYTPIDDGEYLAEDDTYAPIYGEINSARLPTYMKIDLHLEKSFKVWKGNVTTYMELWYVPEFANTMYYAWSYDYDHTTEVHGPSFVPLVGVRGEI